MILKSIIIIPLIGILLISAFKNEKTIKKIGYLISIINWIIGIIIYIKYKIETNTTMENKIEIKEKIVNNIEISVDGISIYFILLTLILIPVCILVSWNMKKIKELIILYLIIESMLLCVFMVLDLIYFYIFYESVLIPMFLIIGIWGSRERKIKAAYQFFIYTLLGSLLMLISILIIWNEYGTTNYEIILSKSISIDLQKLLWLGFFISFAVKTPIIPFHIWLPEAHVEAPTGGSVLLAGILLKLSSYGFIRYNIALFPEASYYYTPLIITLSVISIIYSSLTTLRQIDLKKIIAYSSIAHMGTINLGLFSNNINGLQGAMILIVGHGLISPCLFIIISYLYSRYHTRIINYYKGLTYIMPIFTLLLFILIVYNMGIPLLGPNFIAELLCYYGSFTLFPILTLLALSFNIIIGGSYSIWLYVRLTGGKLSKHITLYNDLSLKELIILLPLLLIILILGIYPKIIYDLLDISLSNLIY